MLMHPRRSLQAPPLITDELATSTDPCVSRQQTPHSQPAPKAPISLGTGGCNERRRQRSPCRHVTVPSKWPTRVACVLMAPAVLGSLMMSQTVAAAVEVSTGQELADAFASGEEDIKVVAHIDARGIVGRPACAGEDTCADNIYTFLLDGPGGLLQGACDSAPNFADPIPPLQVDRLDGQCLLLADTKLFWFAKSVQVLMRNVFIVVVNRLAPDDFLNLLVANDNSRVWMQNMTIQGAGTSVRAFNAQDNSSVYMESTTLLSFNSSGSCVLVEDTATASLANCSLSNSVNHKVGGVVDIEKSCLTTEAASAGVLIEGTTFSNNTVNSEKHQGERIMLAVSGMLPESGQVPVFVDVARPVSVLDDEGKIVKFVTEAQGAEQAALFGGQPFLAAMGPRYGNLTRGVVLEAEVFMGPPVACPEAQTGGAESTWVYAVSAVAAIVACAVVIAVVIFCFFRHKEKKSAAAVALANKLERPSNLEAPEAAMMHMASQKSAGATSVLTRDTALTASSKAVSSQEPTWPTKMAFPSSHPTSDGATPAPPSSVDTLSRWSTQLEIALDSLRERNTLFMGYRILSALECRSGGQGVVQFVERPNGGGRFAIKFYLERGAFEGERQLYNNESLRKMMPATREIYDDRDGALRAPNGYSFPCCIVIERGQSLNEFAHVHHGRLQFITAVQALIVIAERLEGLHAAGFVHRDLKPGNILRLPDTHGWTLIDFGCSARNGSQAHLHHSPSYAPPELIYALERGDNLITAHTSADMWSLGIIAYELLTQSVVFPRSESVTSINDQLMGRAALPWERPEGASEVDKLRRLRQPVMQCLQREPRDRPSVQQLLASWNEIFDEVHVAAAYAGNLSSLGASSLSSTQEGSFPRPPRWEPSALVAQGSVPEERM